jgi:membrane-bound serine protease (ClpP class)
MAVWLAGPARAAADVVIIDIKGAIGPATADFVTRGLERAAEQKATAIILRIDTPGGLDTAMRDIIKGILASPLPVIGWVGPSGSRAASAGTYILYATHVAAMAPGTDLGAATPIAIGAPGMPSPQPGGQKPAREKQAPEKKTDNGKATKKDSKTEKKPEPAGDAHPTMRDKAVSEAIAYIRSLAQMRGRTMRDKAVSEAIAYIRSLAQMRGRNVEWAEKAVREAASLPADEALKLNVIDLMAADIPALLKAVDGRTVSLNGKERKLKTAGAATITFEPDWRSELLGIITNPNVAYILMVIGIYALMFEFYNPGLIGPGVVGAICLLLALYAFNVLPVNYAGLALILLGVALMAAEAFAPSFGVLGVGGVVAFVIGSIMLMDTDVPGFQVYWPLVGGVAAGSALLFLTFVYFMMRARQRAVVSGAEEMEGASGQVVDWTDGQGRVRTHGEVWKARSEIGALEAGTPVRVRQVEGLTLVVEPETKGN